MRAFRIRCNIIITNADDKVTKIEIAKDMTSGGKFIYAREARWFIRDIAKQMRQAVS